MITSTINPVLVTLPGLGLEIRYYGLVYLLGFIFLYFFLKHNSRKIGLKQNQIEEFIVYLLAGMLIGARFFYFFIWNFGLISNPLDFFKIWQGGMAFHGALTGVIIAGILFAKKHKLNFFKLADVTVIPAALFLFFGRIANFINQEIPGVIAKEATCLSLGKDPGCRHPYVLYEGVKNLFLFFGLSYAYFKLNLKPGVLFWYFILLYNGLRFLIDFFRQDAFIGQVLSLIFVAIAIYYLYVKRN